MRSRIFNAIMAAQNSGAYSSGSSLQAETSAYLTAASLPDDDGFAAALDAYVVAIKAAGVFDTDDEHYILANASAGGAVINLINPSQSLTPTSNPSFTQYLGYTGGGNAYLTTPTNLDQLTKYGDEAASFGLYLPDTSTSGTIFDIATSDASVVYASRYSSADDVNFGINGASRDVGAEPELSPAIASSGYYICSLDSISTIMKAYQDGVQFTSNQGATYDPTSAPSSKITLLGFPNYLTFSDRSIGLFHIGGSIDATQAAARNTALQTFLTAIASL